MRPYRCITSLLLLLLPALAVSCIKDDYGDCEPVEPPTNPWKHVVSVADKNYSNGAQFGDPIVIMDESLPFSSYVSSLTLWRHNAALPDYQVYNATLSPTGDVYDLSVESWPAGTNRVTVIGNETNFSQTFDQSSATITLHPEGREYNDIYIGTADVPVQPTADIDIKMQRVKGILVVFMENIPASASSLSITVDNLYAAVDAEMNYSGSTSVTKEFEVTGTDMTLTLILAPTVDAGESTVSITLVNADGERSSRDITTVTINRNEVSGIRERIDPSDGHMVYVYTDGEWDRVVPLEVIPVDI